MFPLFTVIWCRAFQIINLREIRVGVDQDCELLQCGLGSLCERESRKMEVRSIKEDTGSTTKVVQKRQLVH